MTCVAGDVQLVKEREILRAEHNLEICCLSWTFSPSAMRLNGAFATDFATALGSFEALVQPTITFEQEKRAFVGNTVRPDPE